MNTFDILFLIFGSLTAFAAIGIVMTKNVIHAAIFLVICLVSIAGLYVIYDATFLAVVQLMVYAGGVLILLAFGIMLTNRPENGKLLTEHHLILGGIVAAGGLFVVFAKVLSKSVFLNSPVAMPENQVEFIGTGFMTDYIIAFELIAYLLLVVLVGASYFAKKSHT